jgi:hypothetical protein
MRASLAAVAAASLAISALSGASGAATSQARGTIVFAMKGRSQFARLAIVKPDGTGLRTLFPRRVTAEDPVWSPDGTRVGYATQAGSTWPAATAGSRTV